jgi:hypothetical protein
MAELEQELGALGRELAFPPTPEIAPRVTAALGAERARHRWVARGGRRAVALAFALTLLLAGSVLAASEPVREAALDLLGLDGATVELAPEPPPPITGERLRLGDPIVLSKPTPELGFKPLVPATVGAPDAAYLRIGPPGGELSLAYEPRPGLPSVRATGLGLLVSEFRGDLAPEYLGKVLGPGSRARRLRIDGGRAIWIAGAPHTLLYRLPSGAPRETRVRAARRVLLIERGRLLVRLEAGLSRTETVEIARSLERVGNP